MGKIDTRLDLAGKRYVANCFMNAEIEYVHNHAKNPIKSNIRSASGLCRFLIDKKYMHPTYMSKSAAQNLPEKDYRLLGAAINVYYYDLCPAEEIRNKTVEELEALLEGHERVVFKLPYAKFLFDFEIYIVSYRSGVLKFVEDYVKYVGPATANQLVDYLNEKSTGLKIGVHGASIAQGLKRHANEYEVERDKSGHHIIYKAPEGAVS